MRSSLATILRNPISAVGVTLATAAGVVFLFLIAVDVLGYLENPYVGILVFVLVPAVFLLGLLLIPIGLAIERRRVHAGRAAPEWPRFDLNDPSVRRMTLFVLLATMVNLGILSVASYGAVEYTESVEFCGQVCHQVMKPEFVAHRAGSHGRVPCVACHVGPGAEGFLRAKLSGTRQLALVLTDSYRRPIPTPIESMPGVRTSCENCHRPDRFVGDLIKIVNDHADDEANTQTRTTLRLHVGGPIGGTGTGTGIHWHMNRANQVEFVALDEKREQIPYVRVSTPKGEVREYFAEGITPAEIEGKPRRRMDCLDCHSRPAHRFGSSPEREVDAALGAGQMSANIPFLRREAVRVLRAEYPTEEVALREIERNIRDAMKPRPSHGFESADLQQAIAVTQNIYRTNVFPSMKVGWGTYANQLGHTISTGCFRCHDDSHKTRDGLAIRQECELCHAIE
jgi:hypothetical protein